MITELYQITGIVSNICIIAITIWLVKKWFQIKKYFHNIYMDDIDKLIDQAEKMSATPQAKEMSAMPQDNKMKERLIQAVASGKSKEYLGKVYCTDEIEKLDDKELTKLYARYEAVLGGIITQTLKNHICFAYIRAVEFLCPTVSQGRFVLTNSNELNQNLNKAPLLI
jgi:hypothetical protein